MEINPISPDIFRRWKDDPITKEFLSLIQQEIDDINEELQNAYGFLGLEPAEMAKKLAKLVGQKEAYQSVLEVKVTQIGE